MTIEIPSHCCPYDLKPFVEECRSRLIFADPLPFRYPPTLVGEFTTATWSASVPRIKELNEHILGSLRNNANLYAIYTRRDPRQPWAHVYVGHSKSKEMRTRITAHMIKKDAGTGAQLEQVMAAVRSGYSLAVSFLLVKPDSLRLVVEDCILNDPESEFPWNINGRNR